MKMTSFEQALNLRICDLYLIMSLKIHLNKTFLLDVKYVFLSPVSVTETNIAYFMYVYYPIYEYKMTFNSQTV